MNPSVTAHAKYIRLTPRKTRFVVNLIRGMYASDAEAQLLLLDRRASVPVLKLLRSAVANALHNQKLEVAKLFIKEVRVNEGPKIKRWTPRSRGGMAPIQKKTVHITIVLGVKDKAKETQFVMPKKEIKEKEERKKKPHTHSEKEKPKRAEEEEVKRKEEPSTWKRVFRRKAMA